MSENKTTTSPAPQQQQQDSNAQQVQGETNDTTTTGPTTRVVLADRYKTKICEKFQEKGKCPYDRKCMFAHGEHELRTYEMNILDGLTTEENIRQFRRMQRADFQRFLARQEKMQFEKLHGGNNGNGSGNSEGFIPPAQYYQGAPPPAPLPHPTGGNASRSVRSSTPTGPGKNNSSRNSEIGSRPGTSEVHSRASSEHGADSSSAIQQQQQSHPQQQNYQQQYHQQQAPQNTHQWVQQQQQQSQQQQQQYHPSASSQQQQHAQQYQPQNQQQQSYYNGPQQQQYANYQQYNNPAQQQQQQQQQQYNQQQGYPQQQHQYERYQQQYYQQNQQPQQFQQQQQSYNQYYQQQQAANYQWQQPQQQQQYNQQEQQFNNANYVAGQQQGGGNQQQHEQQQRPTYQHQPHEYQQPNGASARVATPVRSNSEAGDFASSQEESQLDGSGRPSHARRGSRGSSTGSGYRFDPYKSAAVDQQYLRHQRPGSAQE